MFAALLDTSVLWPSLQREFLLSLAVEGLYRPLWSSAILDELQLHEVQKLVGRGEHPDAAAARAQHLIDQMATAFDDALVENWEPLDGTFGLPDPLTSMSWPQHWLVGQVSSSAAISKTFRCNGSLIRSRSPPPHSSPPTR